MKDSVSDSVILPPPDDLRDWEQKDTTDDWTQQLNGQTVGHLIIPLFGLVVKHRNTDIYLLMLVLSV